jgi:hypothetical protein
VWRPAWRSDTKERPERTDCFDQDVRRQCRRIINEIYSSSEVFWSGRLSDQHLTIRGTRSLERDLHTRFQAARYNRELFRLTDQDIHCLRM